MILSSPFSRQSKGQQSWTNGASNPASSNGTHYASSSLKRLGPPPPQAPPVPQQPGGHFRSHTLNRLDLLKRRQQQRNMSSLGHYPKGTANGLRSLPATNGLANGIQPAQAKLGPNHKLPASQIYAPASIASPSEFQRRPLNGDSQHYEASSFGRGPNSESGRSGRESALGSLFGTLRRRTRWSRSSSNKASELASGRQSALATRTGTGSEPDEATRKRHPEADEIYAEGSRAIDSNIERRLVSDELDESLMAEGETRTLICESSKLQADYQQLVRSLTSWIQDELAEQRIIVRDLQEDLYDGQILCKLIEKLHQIKLDIVDVTQNELAQRAKLRIVLDTINRILSLQARWARIRWSPEGIHSKNMVEILHLLITLALYYRAPIRMPADVFVEVEVVEKSRSALVRRWHQVQLTDRLVEALDFDTFQRQRQRDAFDTLIEFAPDKLALVKQSLVKFVNRHLAKVRMSCCRFGPAASVGNGSGIASVSGEDDLDPEQFSDGLLLVFLIASLEDYFVPLGNLFTASSAGQSATAKTVHQSLDKLPFIDSNNNTNNESCNYATAIEPTSYTNAQPIHKLHNVNVALQLIEEAGVEVRQRVRAEDIVNGDLKAVLRVLYALFSRYKHL